jgi:hypothetical protein
MRQYRPDVEKQNPVASPVLIEGNLLDVLGDSEAGEMGLEIPQFKESLAPTDLQAQYRCVERFL